MNQVIDFSTLTWVKKELDETLREARQTLEAHVENPGDEAQLQTLAAQLHQVYGTLQMVELYGASLLAEEMEQVAQAMAAGGVSQQDDAREVLMRAILQLPDYLDRLISGHRDIPVVLLPLLNDLRAVRGENLLSDNAMFRPDLASALPGHLGATPAHEELRARARELRHRFQLGLLGWFRGQNTDASLNSLRETLEGLQALGGDDRMVRLWWAAAGVAEALAAGKLEGSIALKRVLGQVDREIKRLIDKGDQALSDDARLDLFNNLLFYCAQAPADTSERMAEIQATYRLQELLPDEQEMSAARESLSGRNSDLFETVAVAVREELARLKDGLDIILRNRCADGKELEPLTEAFRRLGDTLGMLGLGAARNAVVGKADDLQKYTDSGSAPADTVLMDVASTLLLVESSVDNMGSGRAVADADGKAEDQLARNEYRQVMDVVVQEAIGDLVRAKEAIIAYTESDHDTALIAEVPQWFNQVKGGMLLLGEVRPAALVDSIGRYISAELVDSRKQAAQEELDALADAVCGLEYYLESRREHRMYGSSAMEVAEQSVERLGYPADEAAAADQAPAEPAADAAEFTAQTQDSGDAQAGGEGGAAQETTTDAAEVADDGFEFDFSLLDEPGEEIATGECEPDGAATAAAGDPAANEATQLPEEDADVAAAGSQDDQPQYAHSDATSAPLAEPQETQAAEADDAEDDGLAVIGEDVDDEILEIFIEEAEEELTSINEQLPRWLADKEDSEALGTMRRSWHTLKGSGRLVGAMRIGEFAWCFESMLNRVIDGTVVAGNEMQELLQAAADALPGLVAQVKDGTPTPPVAQLMRHADALSKGEAYSAAAETSAAAAPDSETAAEQSEATPPEPDEDVAGVDGEGVDSVSDAYGPSAESGLAGEVPHSDQDAQPADAGPDAEADSVMDPQLYEIFNTESRAHLEAVQAFLNQEPGDGLLVDESLVRALHTLHGSAHMADADAIAELAGGLEKLLKGFMMAGLPADSAVCGLLESSIAVIDGMLSSLPQENAIPDEYQVVLQQVDDLLAAVAGLTAEHWAGQPVEDAATDGDPASPQIATPEEFETSAAMPPELSASPQQDVWDSTETAEELEAEEDAPVGATWSGAAEDGDYEAMPADPADEVAGGAPGADQIADGDQEHGESAEPVDADAQEIAGFEADAAPQEDEGTAGDEATVVTDAGEADGPAAPVDTGDDPYAGHDQELLEVFLEEAADNLDSADSALGRWRYNAQDQDALAALQRALHTLKGGARMADLPEFGDVAHAVESLIIAVCDGNADAGASADSVQQAQDCMADMLERVRDHRSLEPADELVGRLNALHRPADGGAADGEVSAGDQQDIQQPHDDDATASDPYAAADPELLEVFLEEAGDIMEHCEQTLHSWKKSRDNQELMAELQRELHTLKGGARMSDITEIGDLAHAVESLMVQVGAGEVACSDSLFNALERAQDRLAGMVEGVRNRRALEAATDITADLENLRNGREVAAAQSAASTTQAADAESAVGVAMDAENERRERRSKPRASQELVRVKADLLDNMVNYAGEVSIYRSRLEQQIGAYGFNLVEMEQTVARVRDQLRKLEIETEAQVLYRYEREGEMLDEAGEGEDFDPLEMDRYSHMQQLSRSLMESVSDLSSIQNLLENITRESETLLLQQSRVNTELQEGLMRTRMVPFLGLAARMRRIVRQTAQELGKKAELELSGAEGEMDRTVVDRIVAPLEHMLRNSISHGIESPQQRIAAGKPETGTIRITLERESAEVVLRIADDGAGIDLDAIRNKAVARGLMEAGATLSDTEVLQFILETGFSTAEKVTQVAGRGVGMDVVNSEVKQLGGSLQIDSEHGTGTTFTIRLPFTLALNHALLIEVGEDTYAIPLSSIEGIVRMRREDLQAHYDDPESRFEYGGYAYEVRHLGSVLGTGAPHLDSGPKRVPVLLSRFGEHCVAFHVENLLGSREIVVKSVGPQISTVPGVSGATILGDGRVVMILELAALLRGGAVGAVEPSPIVAGRPLSADGVTVMVVDDSITVRKVTTRILERNDMHVIAAKDGVDAVSKLQENIPDIMLLDIEMPRMDGFELATHVRNEPRLRGIPMIMITSRTGDKHRQRAMQIGVNRYLGKPFQESELLESIQALLKEMATDG